MANRQVSNTDSNTSQMQEFAVHTKLLLNDSERQYMYAILREYKTYKRLDALVLCLRSILDTPVKMDLLKDVRQFVYPSHLTRYDRLVPYQNMANPWSNGSMQALDLRRQLRASESDLVRRTEQSQVPASPQKALARKKSRTSSATSRNSSRKIIRIYRNQDQPLSFNIENRTEESQGVYINRVRKGSGAERAGLHPGDQILEVNGVTFDSIDLKDALHILNDAPKLTMLVQPGERSSVTKPQKEIILWYDIEKQCLVEDGFVEHDFLKLFKANSRVYRKVSINVRPGKQYLGFNIRGGSEYDLGIYVSRVDPGGIGENRGVQVGDRLMVVNGISFNNISHYEAVKLLRSHRRLFLILLFVGFYPVCKVLNDDNFSVVSDSQEPHSARRLSRTSVHEKQRKLKPMMFEDTELHHIWKSLSDGELWTNEQEESNDDESISPRPWNTDFKPTTTRIQNHDDHDQLYSEGSSRVKRKGGDVFMRRKEASSLTPTRMENASRDRGERHMNSLPSNRKIQKSLYNNQTPPIKPRRKMKKSKSLVDLSESRSQTIASPENLRALENIENAAYRLHELNEDEIQAILKRTNQYLKDGDIESFLVPLTAILDTGKRHRLLANIRPLIRSQHLSYFDSIPGSKLSSEIPIVQSSGHERQSRFSSDTNFILKRDSPRAGQRSKVASSVSHHNIVLPVPDGVYGRTQRKGDDVSMAGNKGLKGRAERSTNSFPRSFRNLDDQRHHIDSLNDQKVVEYSSTEDEIGDVYPIQPPDVFRDDSGRNRANRYSSSAGNLAFHGYNGNEMTVDDSGSEQEYFGTLRSRASLNVDDVYQHGDVRQKTKSNGSAIRNDNPKRRLDADLSYPNDHNNTRHRLPKSGSDQEYFDKRRSGVDSYDLSQTDYENDTRRSNQMDRKSRTLEDVNKQKNYGDKVKENTLDRNYRQHKSDIHLYDQYQDQVDHDIRSNQRNIRDPQKRTSLDGRNNKLDKMTETSFDQDYRQRSDIDLSYRSHLDYERESRDQPRRGDDVSERNYEMTKLSDYQPDNVRDSSKRKHSQVPAAGGQGSHSVTKRNQESESQIQGTRRRDTSEGARNNHGDHYENPGSHTAQSGGHTAQFFRTSKLNENDESFTNHHVSKNRLQSEKDNSKSISKLEGGESWDFVKQSHSWNWEKSGNRQQEKDGATFNSESAPSVNSALQLLDKVLQSHDSSVNGNHPSHRQSKALSDIDSAASSRSVSPDSDAQSYNSNMTSRHGSYDVTVPSATSSAARVRTKPTDSSSKSSSSRFQDSGLASDFRTNTPVLAGFLLRRDERLARRNDNLDSQFDDSTSRYNPTQHSRPLSLRGNFPGNSISNWGFSTDKTSHKRMSIFSGSEISSAFDVVRRTTDERPDPLNHNESVDSITVYLDKSHENLGLAIAGGSDSRLQPNVMIESVIPGGAAHSEGTLRAGMRILSIDDISLSSSSHQDAIKIIRRAFKDRSMPVMRVKVVHPDELI